MIYLDYSATTPVNEEVLSSFVKATKNYIGNPNSLHKLGVESNKLINDATKQISDILNVKPNEIIYTSGASEANNLAIKGICLRNNKRKHIITTELEHSSVIGPCSYLQRLGYEVDFVKLDENGIVDLNDLKKLIKEDTILVSIASVNSEVGVLQPINEIGKLIKEVNKNTYFHSDITQSVGKVKINLDYVDLASFSAQKFYGLKGVGCLIKKENIVLEPLIHGGKSTTVYRSGTPALGLIVSTAKALRLAYLDFDKKYDYVCFLNKYLKELNCSSKKLSTESGLSESVISRYRSGERTPVKESEQMNKLTTALFNISHESGEIKYTLDKITKDLNSTLPSDNFDYATFSSNLNSLITSLNINTHEMSKYIVFDASHISRIRYGKSRPSNPMEFSNKICSYIFSRYKNPKDISNLQTIIGCKKSDLSNSKLYNTLFTWLTSEATPIKNQTSDFLYNLDSFNLDDYIKVIKFDELKVPSIPFYRAKTKRYYGLEGMKEGELNFFKATVLSKSKEDIFMCSDMPMEDMAEDVDFGKKWMFAIAICLKKGHHLNIIHNLDRPFNEMMLGL